MGSTAKSKIKLSQYVLNTLQEHFTQHPCDKIIVAYSGGIDSHVLLHSLVLARSIWENVPEIQAVHIHHGLNADADQWQSHCQHICDELSVPFNAVQVEVNQAQGVSLEAEARSSRYQALSQFITGQTTVLVTAQHQDDQAETLLLQLIRGAGIAGLSAMPERAVFAKGWKYRPLLDVSKQEIIDYANEHALQWIEDGSNTDRQYARNYLRRDVMPLLKNRWPSVAKTLSRSAQHCADSVALIERLIQPLVEKAINKYNNSLSISYLSELSNLEYGAVIRQFIKMQDFLQPSTQKLAEIKRQFLQAREDSNPVVSWDCCEFRRYRDDLYLIRCLDKHDVDQKIGWSLTQSTIDLAQLGQLNIIEGQGTGLDATKLEGRQLSVRFRQGGETIKIAGHSEHHPLKKWLQEHHVLPWQRDRLPLIYADDQLIQVIMIGISEAFYTAENGLNIEWQPIVKPVKTEEINE